MFAGPIAWLALRLGPKIGPKLAAPLFYIGLVLLIFGVGFTLAKCTGGKDGVAEQAEQTARSTDAMTNAASNAIETLENRVVTEETIDAVTANVQREIGNAQSLDDIRNTVIAGVCGSPAHRNDPACAVR